MADDPKDVTPERPLPSTFYNIRSIVGAWIAGVSLIIITFLIVVELTGDGENPYTGILTFVILPMFLILGLALIALGAIREHQRRQKDLPPSRQLPILDLNRRPHLRAVTWVAFGSVLFLMMSAYGAFKAYEYTETNQFCGEVCHTVMHPEYTAYQDSPHARVHCVECHIGPGAEWFVKSKITGAYQVYAVLADVYPKPIPTPVHNLRPSRDTCEQCHWPTKFYDDKLSTRNYYLPDEENTHMRLDLLLHIGGAEAEGGEPSGIHWHTHEGNRVEYVATDERRQEIPWVRLSQPDGTEIVYVDEESDFDPTTDLEGAEIRTMDCIDCHNRPSHRYGTPMEIVNNAMAEGDIPSDLPWIKSLSVEVLDAGYETTPEAEEAIATRIRDEYAEDQELYDERQEDIEQAIATLQELYRHNFFPIMNANWESYPENIGHLTAPGCFRCHDGMHVADDGEAISRDCTDCHAFLAQELGEEQERIALAGIEYQHPEDIGGAWEFMDCTECHAP